MIEKKEKKQMVFRLFMEVIAGFKAELEIIGFSPRSRRCNLVVFTGNSEGKEGSSSSLFCNLLLTMSTGIFLLNSEIKRISYK